ncbi:tetratricopeptide repeat protein [Ancylobacter sp. A5.8]|uniref:tetratricopeptide repeat protein n=1 Tax=Ancylobacter gelatini TaxID=2919920 RepID=UPI001F4DA8AB|nr:tetratricopeptide repeat protein [Ancylobacter gelatini]MCJ8144709.1 tetratricopeptide repeat protein [Ancylobacter gelatini]
MRALFIALALTLAPLGAALHAQEQAPGQGSPPAARSERDAGAKGLGEKGAADKSARGGPSLPSADANPDQSKRLDALFAALKVAPDDASAKSIADRIDVALTPSGSDTADVLMSRAAMATQAKAFDLAIELLDGVLAIEPDHLDAWNRRATVFYMKQDYADALNDLRQVVTREPRHYAAWSGIAIIAKEVGDDKHALEAARRALDIYPRFGQAKDIEEELTITVEGRPI